MNQVTLVWRDTQTTQQTLKRITKAKAQSLYLKGTTVYVLPCKMAATDMFGPWGLSMFDWIKRQGSAVDTVGLKAFKRRINSYEMYNCQYETGYYSAYYQITESRTF